MSYDKLKHKNQYGYTPLHTAILSRTDSQLIKIYLEIMDGKLGPTFANWLNVSRTGNIM